jgi:hypothetical protein
MEMSLHRKVMARKFATTHLKLSMTRRVSFRHAEGDGARAAPYPKQHLLVRARESLTHNDIDPLHDENRR